MRQETSHFDPYHVWLGIPPEEQPPNFYRLLGLVDLESDPAVIQNAADRQMAYIRQFAIGPRSRESQVMANYIAEAAGTLLDPARKAEYDGWLGGFGIAPDPFLAEIQDSPPAVFAEPPPMQTVPRAPIVRTTRRSSRSAYRRHHHNVGIPAFVQWIAGGLAGIALALLIVSWLFDVSPQKVLKQLQEPPAKSTQP